MGISRKCFKGIVGAKPSKYRNIKTVVDGITFDSKREAARWGELKLMERAGKIKNVQKQVPFVLSVNGIKIGKIIIDFTYETDRVVYEDVKSTPTLTPIFRWKSKHFSAQYGHEIAVWK